MARFARVRRSSEVPLDGTGGRAHARSQVERANWVASRVGLPPIGSTLLNEHGIQWVVQEHAALPTYDSLCRWRCGDIQPQHDLYPVITPTNFSPELSELFRAIDRCTTKVFAIVDTMPGRRSDGHVPGGNYIDTVCQPATNVVFLDAARANESTIAHELGHAWVQYVDDCEDLRTMKDASVPQRMRLVGFVQSFVLDLKVNDLIRRKGFDMNPIDEDRRVSLRQLAQALGRGYSPKHAREEVFMALLVADRMVEVSRGASRELARANQALEFVRDAAGSISSLAGRFAETVARHGYDAHAAIVATIDECLISAFEHCGDPIDLDADLVAVDPVEPNIDKFPAWLPELSPRTKTDVGKYMALNDISSDWSQCLKPSITGKTRVHFGAPGGDIVKQVQLNERIGPPNRYSDLPEGIAEQLALKHLNQTGSYQLHGGPAFHTADLYARPDAVPRRPQTSRPPAAQPNPPTPIISWPPRPYMAGCGRFLTQAALEMQLAGEHPYGYALSNPLNYVDPTGEDPCASSDCSKFPGGPCAYAKSQGDDEGDIGGIICCDGKKYVCIWKSNEPPGGVRPRIQSCLRKHERSHLRQVVCPPSEYGRPAFKPGEDADKDECRAYAIEIACYIKQRHAECGKLKDKKREDCIADYRLWICDACKNMKDQYGCSPSKIPSECKGCP